MPQELEPIKPTISTDTSSDSGTFVGRNTVDLNDPHVLHRVRNRFYPGYWTKEHAAREPYEKRPLYIVYCKTPAEADLAWAAKPTFVRTRFVLEYESYNIPQLEPNDLEHLLDKASRQRQLAAALMDNNWAGVRLLNSLRDAQNMTVGAVNNLLGFDEHISGNVVSQLAKSGLINRRGKRIWETPTGLGILQTLEHAAGVDLHPDAHQ